jgi:hypothetical protein
MNWHDKQRALREAGRRLDARERAERLESERQEAEYNRRLAAGEITPAPEPTAEELAEAEAAEARRIARLPWWERQTDEEKAASEAARQLSRYLSC